jgi:hypothetical protein
MTLRSVAATVVALTITCGVAHRIDAQPSSNKPAAQKPPAPPPAPPATGAKPGADAPPPPPPAPTRDGRTRRLGPNVRVEVTLSEAVGNAPTQPKAVTVTTSDGHWGRVRTTVHTQLGRAPLNVDIKPDVQPDGRVMVALNIEYGIRTGGARPVTFVPGPGGEMVPNSKEEEPVQPFLSELNESVTVVLENDRPLVVTRSADPIGDRKVTVEVKATVLR